MYEILFEIKDANVFIPGRLERTLVLKNINWRLSKGRHCAILGANGAGKSSLLKLIHGDLWPCSGSICWYVNGQRETSRIAARELTAIVSPDLQERLQRSPWPLSLKDFLLSMNDSLLQIKSATGRDGAVLERTLEAMGLKDMLGASLNHLSQGQLRLALLLRALLKRPRVLLLDEYTDGLDANNRHLALELLQNVRDKTTIIFTSHHPASLPPWCQGRFYLHEGKQQDCYQSSVPHDETPFEIQDQALARPLFALSNVTVYIERQRILKKINWQARQGEHWRIIGDNGSGKSTLLRLLAGDEFAAADGEILRWKPKSGCCMTTLAEVRSMFMLVSDLSQIQNDYPLCSLELLCTAFDNSIGLHREVSADEKERALAILGEFFPEQNLAAFAYEDIRRLSTGQLRRLYLARAMLAKPAALLLDEPLNGLDTKSRAQYLALLRGLAAKGSDSPAIIMVSHNDDETPAFIRRMARLEQGCLKIVL